MYFIGIDLGTATILVYIKDKGVVLREPSVVAIDKNNGKLSEDVVPYLFKKGLYADIADYFASAGAKRVCLDPALISVKQLQTLQSRCEGIEFGYMSDICLKHRQVKTEAEVAKIRTAQSITDAKRT